MKRKYILLLSALLTSLLYAQDDAKYLKGAITETDGKVVFNRIIESDPKLTDDKLFDKINQWVEKKYNLNDGKTDNRVLLSDKEKKQVGCMGENLLVFGRKLLSFDSAPMKYQLILEVSNGKCEATIRGIRYEYSDGRKNENLKAEDMITDKYALNKGGEKLANYYGKFRKATIDTVNVIFNSLETFLNGKSESTNNQVQYIYIDKNTGEEVPQPTSSPVVTNTPVTTPPIETAKSTIVTLPVNENAAASLPGYKNITADNIPDNYIKLLNSWTLITSGKNEVNTMTASWGGLGIIWDKPITFCFLNPTRYSIKTMDEGDTYTISFYGQAYKDILEYCGTKSGRDTDKIKGSGLTPIKTPTGATAFSEAWLIIECRKLIAQPISEAAVKINKAEINKDWTKDGLHKMYVGEILNVWIK